METEKEFETTPAGNHICTLRVKPVEVPVFIKKDGKWKKTEKTRPGYRFVFKVEDKDWYICSKGIGKTESEKGGLFKMMRMCADSFLSEIEFDEKGYAKDKNMFYKVLSELENSRYEVTCEHSEWNGKTYTNFVKCKPYGPKDPLHLKKEIERTAGPEDISYEQDDILF